MRCVVENDLDGRGQPMLELIRLEGLGRGITQRVKLLPKICALVGRNVTVIDLDAREVFDLARVRFRGGKIRTESVHGRRVRHSEIGLDGREMRARATRASHIPNEVSVRICRDGHIRGGEVNGQIHRTEVVASSPMMRNTSRPVAIDPPELEVAVIEMKPCRCVDGAGAALVTDIFHERKSRMHGEMRLYFSPPKPSHCSFE